MNCSDCQDDPEQKSAWGCETPTQVPVWVDDDSILSWLFDCYKVEGETESLWGLGDEYYICPFKLIADEIFEWYREYSYYKTFTGSAPRYQEQTEHWLTCMMIYEHYFSQFTIEKMKTKKPDQPRG